MSNINKRLAPFAPDPQDARLGSELQQMADVIEKFAPGKGREIVVAISQEFASTHVYFIKVEKMFRQIRDQWVRDKYDDGHRVPDIARATKLSDRQVWNILGKEPGEDRQLNLFDAPS